jgi:hypothetical protein
MLSSLPPHHPIKSVTELDGARFGEKLWPDIIGWIYAEDVRGISSDAILLIQKVMAGWSDWVDYDTGVPRLVVALRATGRLEALFRSHGASRDVIGTILNPE